MTEANEFEQAGAQFLETLFKEAGWDLNVGVGQARDEWHVFELEGETDMLKKKPELVSAITLLTSQVVSRAGGSSAHCLLDFEGGFEAREAQLITLADDLARAVARNGRKAVLDALTSSERRVVHLHLKEHDEVQTRSENIGSRRLLVVEPR